jgi:hypothetical protein
MSLLFDFLEILKDFARNLLDNHPWIDKLAAHKDAVAFAEDLMTKFPEKIEDPDAILSMSDVIARIRTNMFIGAAPDDTEAQVCALLRYSRYWRFLLFIISYSCLFLSFYTIFVRFYES